MSEVQEQQKPLYTFQLIAGSHQGNKKRYKKGDVVQTHQPLDEMFVGKFQRLPNAPAIIDDGPDRIHAVTDDDARPISPADKIRDVVPFSFTEATNVTHLFADAKAAGLSVYKDSLGGYAVAEKDAKVLTNIAGVILGSKKKVAEFLANFVPSDLPD